MILQKTSNEVVDKSWSAGRTYSVLVLVCALAAWTMAAADFASSNGRQRPWDRFQAGEIVRGRGGAGTIAIWGIEVLYFAVTELPNAQRVVVHAYRRTSYILFVFLILEASMFLLWCVGRRLDVQQERSAGRLRRK